MKKSIFSYVKNNKGIIIMPAVILFATVGVASLLLASNKSLNLNISRIHVGDYIDYDPTIASLDGTLVDEDKLTYTSPIGLIPKNNIDESSTDDNQFTNSNTITNTTNNTTNNTTTNTSTNETANVTTNKITNTTTNKTTNSVTNTTTSNNTLTNEQESSNETNIEYADGDIITHGNGYSSQTFTAKPLEDLKWRVLSISNDTIELISENIVRTDTDDNFIVKGAIGYLYAEQELNEICKIYGYGYGSDTDIETSYNIGGPFDTEDVGIINGSGARSITMDDINNLLGYTEDDLKSFNSNYNKDIILPSSVYYPSLYSTNKTNIGQSKDRKNTFTNTYYTFNKSIIEDLLKQSLIFSGNYWIATRGISTDTDSSTMGALVYLTNGDDLNGGSICYGNTSNLGDYTANFLGVRPIVSIKTTAIDFSDENVDGTKENAWQLK